jgi:beta-glucosidase
MALGGFASLFDVLVTASIEVTNSGPYDGKEITQLYVQFPAAANLPIRELRGFEATYLYKGQSATINFNLQRRDLSDWNVGTQKWTLVPGQITLLFARSSRDFISSIVVELPL